MQYKTYPEIRCEKCQGRLVVQTDGTSTKRNLVKQNGLYFCKNKEECNQNIKAEETILDIIATDNSLKFKHNGHDILEVKR